MNQVHKRIMEETTGDILEANCNFFYNAGRDLKCVFYTNKESVKNRVLKRNSNCKVWGDEYGYFMEFDRDQVRAPETWIKIKGNEED